MEIRVDRPGRRRWICRGLKRGGRWEDALRRRSLHACMYGACHVTRDAYVHRRMDLLTWTGSPRNDTIRYETKIVREQEI